MKTLVLALTTLLLTFGAGYAHASADLAFTLVPTASAPSVATSIESTPAVSLAPASASASHFAQFDTRAKSMPISSSMVFALIALFIVGTRLMGVRQAHSMAEQERHSVHGRAQMFRSLHEERSSHR